MIMKLEDGLRTVYMGLSVVLGMWSTAFGADSAPQMPWETNTPIVSVKKELLLPHPRPRAAALSSVQYVGPELQLLRRQSVEVRDDVHGEIFDSLSLDNGR